MTQPIMPKMMVPIDMSYLKIRIDSVNPHKGRGGVVIMKSIAVGESVRPNWMYVGFMGKRFVSQAEMKFSVQRAVYL